MNSSVIATFTFSLLSKQDVTLKLLRLENIV